MWRQTKTLTFILFLFLSWVIIFINRKNISRLDLFIRHKSNRKMRTTQLRKYEKQDEQNKMTGFVHTLLPRLGISVNCSRSISFCYWALQVWTSWWECSSSESPASYASRRWLFWVSCADFVVWKSIICTSSSCSPLGGMSTCGRLGKIVSSRYEMKTNWILKNNRAIAVNLKYMRICKKILGRKFNIKLNNQISCVMSSHIDHSFAFHTSICF